MFEQLNLKELPFRTSADEKYASVWAGRPTTRTQIDRLLRKMQLFHNSALHIIWANFGMGKTHTLYHIRHRSQERMSAPFLIPVYATMPKRSTGFLELYREIVQSLPYDFLKKQIQKLGSSYRGSISLHPMFQRSPGVVKALLAIDPEDFEANTAARQWLAAQPGLSRSDLNRIDVTYRIKTPEDAINALNALTNLAVFDPDPTKQNQLVVMIDEYQRVGELRQKIWSENNSSLHTYFNQHPTGLQLLLSFSFGNKDNVDYLLSPELKSRAAPQTITLDILTPTEACEFVRDLLSQFRIEQDERWAYPFTPEAVEHIIQSIAQQKTITPRRLMLYFDHVLKEVYVDNDDPGPFGYSVEAIQKYLEDPELGRLDLDAAPESSTEELDVGL